MAGDYRLASLVFLTAPSISSSLSSLIIASSCILCCAEPLQRPAKFFQGLIWDQKFIDTASCVNARGRCACCWFSCTTFRSSCASTTLSCATWCRPPASRCATSSSQPSHATCACPTHSPPTSRCALSPRHVFTSFYWLFGFLLSSTTITQWSLFRQRESTSAKVGIFSGIALSDVQDAFCCEHRA